MRTVSIRLLSLAIIALVCAPAPAMAKKVKTHAPPGNSGVDEYLEVVPDGGGNRPARQLKGGPGGHALGGQTRSKLRSYGQDGQSVSHLADTTSTAPSRKKGTGASAGAAGALGRQASSPTDHGTFAALKGTL